MQVIPNIFYIFSVYHNFINDNMSSINQLVSEIAHVAQEPNNNALRVAIKREIIHARNELIRKSYNNHSITDKVLQQRFRLSIIDIPDEIYKVLMVLNFLLLNVLHKKFLVLLVFLTMFLFIL